MIACVRALALLVCLCGPAAAQSKRAETPKAKSSAELVHVREDERALRAFAALSAAEQRDLCDYLELQLRDLDSFQLALMRPLLKHQDRDSALWPAPDPPPVFDPLTHCPAQPIPRRSLDPDSSTARSFKEQVYKSIPPRPVDCAYTYDYASRELRRAANAKDPARIFKNALAGFPPDYDLCEALVERMLDDGSQQKVLAAFAHAYTDREGTVFADVPLYDVWTARIEMEMPDVDNLGIVHDVLGDFKTWVAPVDASQHDALYAKIGALYTAAHRHRSLRHALARTYLCGSAVLRDQYDPNLDNFHALWEANDATPSKLFEKLPTPEKWADFLSNWTRTCKSKPAIFKAGVQRRVELDGNAQALRATLLAALTEFGAYERLDKQTPAPGKSGAGDH